MSKYIPADKLIAEIERQQRNLIVLSNTEQVDIRRDCALQNGVYSYILDIITSLQQEQPEADLEKELKEYFSGWVDSPDYGQALNSDGECVSTDEAIALARHFAEWGAIHLNVRKEEG